MALYRMKSRPIDATQLPPTRDHAARTELELWLAARGARESAAPGDDGTWSVTTIHGERAPCRPGDWLIAEPGGGGLFRVCDDARFQALYEPMPADPTRAG